MNNSQRYKHYFEEPFDQDSPNISVKKWPRPRNTEKEIISIEM